MAKVLLIDDDRLPMKYYVKRLQKECFDVIQKVDPDEAWAYLETNPDIDCIILDIMMSPGRRYAKQDTNEGLKTGVLLYHDIRNKYPTVPVIVLTNINNPNTLKELDKDPHLTEVRKAEYPPKELAELLNNLLG
jgi:CheY-like chemotaxis protein